jgi:hypothetical protein
VIAVRWGMLAVSTALMLAAFGARSAEWPPSVLRLLVTAIVGLLSPLFWPGNALTAARTAARVVAWSAAAAGLAAIALGLVGGPSQPPARILESCAMLMLILLVAHTVAAALEGHLRARSPDAADAREMAGRTVTLMLALLGSLPLWLGPTAELLSRRHTWTIDAVVGVSPLTHLAVASGNDLLRNEWLYQNSNLAALQFTYPGAAELIGSYVSVCLLLVAVAAGLRRSRRTHAAAAHAHAPKEKSR